MPARRKPGEVPLIIQQLGKAKDDDLKPTMHFLGQLLFSSWPKPESAPPERAPPRPRLPAHRNGAARGMTITAIGQARPPTPSAKPAIVDAEIVEEDNFSAICPTCGGAGILGRPGHEVPCPTCH